MVEHSIIGIVLPRDLTPHTTIMHGCRPISSFKEITRIDGPVLYELDGVSATDVFSEMLGIDSKDICNSKIPFIVTLGKKYGEPYSPFNEQMYVNRLVVDANPEEGSVTIFEADFQQGDMVQVMSRDNQLMVESVDKGTTELLETIDLENAEFALYIDCAGRASGFSGSETEEADVVRKAAGKSIPFLGFYSGVEIAPLLGRSRPLDWTGVLTIFTNG
jgi:small ligand-binding sensory domain FIST